MKKTIKIILIVVAILFSLLLSTIGLMSIPSVQRYVTNKVASSLSKELKTKVTVKRVVLTLRLEVRFEDFLIGDKHNDTLLYSNRLTFKIGGVNTDTRHLVMNRLSMENGYINIKRYLGDADFNYQFIADYLSSQSTDSKSTSKPWQLSFKSIQISNCRLNYQLKPSVGDYTHLIDYDNMSVRNLNANVSDIEVYSDSTLAKVNSISFVERSGFSVKKIQWKARIYEKKICFDELKVETPYTKLDLDMIFRYRVGDNFNHFVDSVNMEFEFNPSKVSFYDLSYFSPEVMGMTEVGELRGHFFGPVSDLSSDNFSVRAFSNTLIGGTMRMTGLPEVNNTFVFFKIRKLVTNVNDLNKIPIPPFTNHEYVTLPSSLNALGKLDYQGEVVGFFNDIVAKGKVRTDLGIVDSDIKLGHLFDGLVNTYSGRLNTENFDIGTFTNQRDILGKLSMSININGKRFDENLEAKVSGNIASIVLKGYDYNNIKLDGNVGGKTFIGEVSIDEENIKLDFDGKLDFSGKIPVFNFKADLAHSNLCNLNLTKHDSLLPTALSTKMIFNFTGSNLDNINGIIKFDETKYTKNAKVCYAEQIFLVTNESEGNRYIRLKSDFVDANFLGTFSFANIVSDLKGFVNKYIPSCNYDSISGMRCGRVKFSENQDFSFDVRLKNITPITELFLPALRIEKRGQFTGFYKSNTQDLKLDANIPSLVYQGQSYYNTLLSVNTANDQFSLNGRMGSLVANSTTSFNNLVFNCSVKQNNAGFSVQWDDKKENGNFAGDINGKGVFKRLDKLDLFFDPSKIILADSTWQIFTENAIQIDSNSVSIHDLNVSMGQHIQNLLVSGTMSEKTGDSLYINFNKFDIARLNFLTNPSGYKINGLLSGKAVVAGIYGVPFLKSELDIQDLVVNEDQLGVAKINSSWIDNTKSIKMNAAIYRGAIKTFELDGNYYPERSADNLDFDVFIDRFQLRMFEHYAKDLISNISRKAIAMGQGKIKGTFAEPDISGEVSLLGVGFKVDYLNTYYTFANKISVTKNGFYFNNLVMNDTAGNVALINGKITHRNYTDFKLDFNVDFRKFAALNTTIKQNDLYYGQASLTGRMQVKGTPMEVIMDIAAKTEKGTKFYLPLNSGYSVSENQFITFVQKDTTLKHADEKDVDLSGLKMNFDLTVTPDAEAQIILDERMGDIIKAKGNANFKFGITSMGDFKMYGDYIIEDGDYLFTLQNVINKHFTIEKGSSIKWNGSPYDAIADIRADYKPRASLKPLRPVGNVGLAIDTTSKRIPVKCVIVMKDNLFNPNIGFEILFPDMKDESSRNYYETVVKPDITQQVFSLLVLNSFMVPSNFKGGEATQQFANSSPLGTNTSEFISGQLTNWLSQISKDVNLGVVYRAGDQINSTEIEVMSSMQLFDDRVSIDGAFGKAGGNAQQPSSIVGDVNIEYRPGKKDGAFKIKAYNKTNTSTSEMLIHNSLYTQGVGVFYRKEFDKVRDLFTRKKK